MIRRVLLISVFHSTLLAFQDNGWEPTRIRPVELLRASFDDVVGRMKRSEFEAVRVDLTDARQFAGAARAHQPGVFTTKRSDHMGTASVHTVLHVRKP